MADGVTGVDKKEVDPRFLQFVSGGEARLPGSDDQNLRAGGSPGSASSLHGISLMEVAATWM